MSLSVFSSPTSFTQNVQFSRNKRAESKSAQPQFTGGTDSYSFSSKAVPQFGSSKRRKGTLDLLGDALHKGIGPSLKKAARDAEDVQELERELESTKTALEKEQNKLAPFEGQMFFKPEVKVLTGNNGRPLENTTGNDPSGGHVFVQWKRYDVSGGRLLRDESGRNDVQVNRMAIEQYPSRVVGRDPRTNSALFYSAYPDVSRDNHPLYHWRG